jgi:nucleoside-diphosphate-sugar epimerase
MERALVTGATGFVGSHLAEALVESRFEVRCLVRSTSNLRHLEKLPISFTRGDITDSDSLAEAVKDVDYIFHFAGLLTARSSADFRKINAQGTANLIQACIKHNKLCKRFIYCSSLAAAGPAANSTPVSERATPKPVSAYGQSKLEGETAVKNFASDISYTIIRPPAVYGPRDARTFLFFKMVKNHIAPIVGRRDQQFSLVYVKDLVAAVIAAAQSPQAEQKTYFITDGKAHTWDETASEIASALGHIKMLKVHVPSFVLSITSIFAELYSYITKNPSILSKEKLREINQRFWLGDDSAIRRDLNYKEKYDLHDGMIETVKWYRENKWL